MADLKSVVAEKLPLTMGETIALAKEYGVRVVDVVLTESELRTGLDREGVLKAVMEEYAHNLKAVEIGVSGGNSFLLGTVPTQLKEMGPGTIFADVLLDKALMYTVAAEVGNHCIGVRPCASVSGRSGRISCGSGRLSNSCTRRSNCSRARAEDSCSSEAFSMSTRTRARTSCTMPAASGACTGRLSNSASRRSSDSSA